jgi:methylglyoxal synthase
MDDHRAQRGPKALIGALVGKDDSRRHDEIVRLLDDLVANDRDGLLANFAFVFTGGTYKRVFGLDDPPKDATVRAIKPDTRDYLIDKSGVIRLPHHSDAGVVFLTYLVVQRRISIVWPFLTPVTPHWLQTENVALMRLCDYWHVNRLLNAHSVREWFPEEAVYDTRRHTQKWPPEELQVPSIDPRHGTFHFVPREGVYEIDIPKPNDRPRRVGAERRLALIAHDDMKDRMAEFALDYDRELDEGFAKILTTSTTGNRVKEVAPRLSQKIHTYHSGPKGGDIQIAAEIILGLVDVVIFFVDPLHPHPHIDDIRVVFGACMMQPVRMLSNERQAREWMRHRC